jgi:hypothetical protein
MEKDLQTYHWRDNKTMEQFFYFDHGCFDHSYFDHSYFGHSHFDHG